MSDDTFLTFIRIAQSLAFTVMFLISTVVVFFMFRQPKLKAWFDEVGVLAQIVAFIILSELVAQTVNIVISQLFALPIALVQTYDEFFAGVQCFSGLLILAALVTGSWLLWKRAEKTLMSSLAVAVDKKPADSDEN